MRGIIGICGTPGTGKKTVAPLVASLLGLPEPISINSFASMGDVDPSIVRKNLLRVNPARAVIVGHLLPHVLSKSELGMVAVLRCDPLVLGKRLSKRAYPPIQVIENIEAELIGVVLDECVRKFGDGLVHEYDTTSASPEKLAGAIASDASKEITNDSRRAKSRARSSWIDWTLDYDSSTKLRSLLAIGRELPGST